MIMSSRCVMPVSGKTFKTSYVQQTKQSNSKNHKMQTFYSAINQHVEPRIVTKCAQNVHREP